MYVIKKPRPVEEIDAAFISMHIKDDLNQTLKELSERIAKNGNYEVDDVLSYFKTIELGYYDREDDGGVLYYTFNKWIPREEVNETTKKVQCDNRHIRDDFDEWLSGIPAPIVNDLLDEDKLFDKCLNALNGKHLQK